MRQPTIFNDSLLEQMQCMNRSWIENLRRIRQIESDFGARVLCAKNSAEAINICSEWMRQRLEVVSDEHRTFVAGWLSLISDLARLKAETPAKSDGATHPHGQP